MLSDPVEIPYVFWIGIFCTPIVNIFLETIPSKHSSWWKRLEGVLIKTNIFPLIISLQKTSSRRLEDILSKTNIFVIVIRLRDVFKTPSSRLSKTSWRRLEDALERCLEELLKKVFRAPWRDTFKTSSRRFQDIFKTSSRRLEDLSSS